MGLSGRDGHLCFSVCVYVCVCACASAASADAPVFLEVARLKRRHCEMTLCDAEPRLGDLSSQLRA